jgi:hypothetical protein
MQECYMQSNQKKGVCAMVIPSFPFPERNDKYNDVDIFSHKHICNTFEEYNHEYQRKISAEAISIRNQYFSIEEEMINSFQYVLPIKKNLSTTSVRFATIIRESSNLFEILARTTYIKLYKISAKPNIKIKNFLTIDYYLDLSTGFLESPMLQSEFKDSHIFQPFKSLEIWDKNSEISDSHIPSWWSACNKIKHSINGLNDNATFENALLSLGAAYLTISRVFGYGLVGGVLYKPERVSQLNTNLIVQALPVSKLYIENTTSFEV